MGQIASYPCQNPQPKSPLGGTTMNKFKPQFRRLLEIDNIIRKSRDSETLPNCSTIAARLECSPKTIRRDLDYLKYDMDAPLEYDPVRYGYYYSTPDFFIPALRVLEKDIFAICLADKVLKQYENTSVYQTLEKVFAKIEKYLPDNVSVHPVILDERVSFFPDASPTLDPEIWEEALKALRLGYTLQMTYQIPGRPEPYENRVDPYHVVAYRCEWYIIGFCHYKKAIRMFAISRIKKASITKQAFQIPKDFDFEEQWKNHFGIMAGSDEHSVVLSFRADQAPYVKERNWHPSQSFTRMPDGSLQMSFRTSHLFEVTRWVLSWGSAVTVIEPQELASAVASEARRISEQYQIQPNS